MGISGVRALLEKRYKKAAGALPVDAPHAFDVLVIELNPLLHYEADMLPNGAVDALCANVLCRLEALVALCTGDDGTLPAHVGVVVDGPAPIAKLPVQRQRRAQYAKQGGFNKALLTPGSSLMVRLGGEVEAWGKRVCAASHSTSLFVSSAGVPGEGENKVIRWLWRLCDDGALLPGASVCVASADIDLALALLASPVLYNVATLDPATRRATNLGTWGQQLLREAEGAAGAAGAGYEAVRLDFACLQLLRGSDCVPALEGCDVSATWEARLRKVEGSVFAWVVRGGARGVAVRPAALRACLRKATRMGKQGGRRGKPAGGGSARRYLEAVLWSLTTLLTGVCPDYRLVYDLPPVDVDALVAHLKALEAEDPDLLLAHGDDGEAGSSPRAPSAVAVPEPGEDRARGKKGQKKKKKEEKKAKAAAAASPAADAVEDDGCRPASPQSPALMREDVADVDVDAATGAAVRAVPYRSAGARLPPPPVLYLACASAPCQYSALFPAKAAAALQRDPLCREVLHDAEARAADVVDAAEECFRAGQVSTGRFDDERCIWHAARDVLPHNLSGSASTSATTPVRLSSLFGVGTEWELDLPRSPRAAAVPGSQDPHPAARPPGAPLCVAVAAALVAVGVSLCSVVLTADA